MSLDVLKANRIVGQVDIEGTETIMDPVSKFRVSNPQNLIDTDFEYGLQSTKWETIELINNIPTFFRREGDPSVALQELEVNAGSDVVHVFTSVAHNFTVGNPIVVKGAANIIADGTYIVLSTPTATEFTYQARRTFPLTTSILDLSTEIYPAALYQGTEFKLDGLGAVEIDDSSPSNIIVSTLTPHGFSVGTTFILVNSLVSATFTFGPDAIDTTLLVEEEIPTNLVAFPTAWQVDIQEYDQDPGNATSDQWVDIFQSVPGVDEAITDGYKTLSFLDTTGQKLQVFGEPYEYAHFIPDGYIVFSNSTTYSGGTTNANPPTSLEGLPWLRIFPSDKDMFRLTYISSPSSVLVRVEARPANDVTFSESNPGDVYEILFDVDSHEITINMLRISSVINGSNYSVGTEVAILFDSGDGNISKQLSPANPLQIIDNLDDPGTNMDSDNYGALQIIPREYWDGSAWQNYQEIYQSNPNTVKFIGYTGGMSMPHATAGTGVDDWFYYQGDMYTSFNMNRWFAPTGRRDLYPNDNTAKISPYGLVDHTDTNNVPATSALQADGARTFFLSRNVAEKYYEETGHKIPYIRIKDNVGMFVDPADPTVLMDHNFTDNTPFLYVPAPYEYGLSINGTNFNSNMDVWIRTAAQSYTYGTITNSDKEFVVRYSYNVTEVDSASTANSRFDFGLVYAYYGGTYATDATGPHVFAPSSHIQACLYKTNAGGIIVGSASDTFNKNGYQAGQEVVFGTGWYYGAVHARKDTTSTRYFVNSVDSTQFWPVPSTTLASDSGVGYSYSDPARYSRGVYTYARSAGSNNFQIYWDERYSTFGNSQTDNIRNVPRATEGWVVECMTEPYRSNYFGDTNGIVGVVYEHSGTRGRTMNISLLKPLNQSIGNLTYGTIDYRLYNGERFAAGIDIPYYQGLQISQVSATNTPLIGFNHGYLGLFVTPVTNDDNYGTIFKYNHGITEQTTTKVKDVYRDGVNFTVSASTYPNGLENNSFISMDPIDNHRLKLNSTSGAQLNVTRAGYSYDYPVFGTKQLTTTDYKESNDGNDWPWKSRSFSCVTEYWNGSYVYWYAPQGNIWNNAPNAYLYAGSAGATTGRIVLSTSEIEGNRYSNSSLYVGGRVLIYNSDGSPKTFNNGEKMNDYDMRVYSYDGSGTSNIYWYWVTPSGAPDSYALDTGCYVVVDAGYADQIISEDDYGSTGTMEWIKDDPNRLMNQEVAYPSWYGGSNRYRKWKYADGHKGIVGNNMLMAGGLYRYVGWTSSSSYLQYYMTSYNRTVDALASNRKDGVVTVTTTAEHFLSPGMVINITGNPTTFTSSAAIVRSVTPYTFTYDRGQDGQLDETPTSLSYDVYYEGRYNYSGGSSYIESISAISAASPAVMTLGTNSYWHGQSGYIFNHQDNLYNPTTNAAWVGPEGQPLNTVKVWLYELTSTTFELYLDDALTIPFDTTSYGAMSTTGVAPIFYPEGPIIEMTTPQYNYQSRESNLNANTFNIPDNRLTNGTLVTYNAGTGTAIDPLTTGTSRYVFDAIGDRFKLSTSEEGYQDEGRRFLHNNYGGNLFRWSVVTGDGPAPAKGTMVRYEAIDGSSDPGGLKSGGYYYYGGYGTNTTYFQLYYTKQAAIDEDSNYVVERSAPYVGLGRIRPVDVVDLTSKGTSQDQTLTTQSQLGILDGLYTITDNEPILNEEDIIGDKQKFVLGTSADINKRQIDVNPLTSIDLRHHAFYAPQHSLFPGTRMVYRNNGNTSISTLVDGNDYFVIKLSNSWFQIAASAEDADDGVYIEIDLADGTTSPHSFEVPTIVGSVVTSGTLQVNLNSNEVIGEGTSFSSFIKSGDSINWSYISEESDETFTFSGTTCTASNHRMLTGNVIRFDSQILDPTGLVTDQLYYVRDLTVNTFQLHPTYQDAIDDTNAISPTGGTGPFYYKFIQQGASNSAPTRQVLSTTKAVLDEQADYTQLHKYTVTQVSITNTTTGTVRIYTPTEHPFEIGQSFVLVGTGDANIDEVPTLITGVVNSGRGNYYFDAVFDTVVGTSTNTYELTDMFAYVSSGVGQFSVSSALLLRADSASMHRPYDGGVELITSSNPNATMIRQTRKYFRYQSGKGIQVSFAINFSPTVPIDEMFVVNRGDTVATIKTRNPSKVAVGLDISIVGDSVDAPNGFNTESAIVTEIVDDYTFKVEDAGGFGAVTNRPTGKFPEFFANEWSDCRTRCGLFDDQNGMFWEYDGSYLYAVRRNSTTQLAGVCNTTFNSAEIRGSGSRWLTQLDQGDVIVLKGQSYKVVQVAGNELLYVQPAYRGITANNVVASVVRDLRVRQDQFNIDKIDGSGPTKNVLDIHTIQMAYIDYSWYGAGKIRFGFKDQKGHVRYVHEFIHGNFEREAYMRSGNVPARYEVTTGDNPSFVPSLAHWGTSIIMDGTFDDDKAYLFSASSGKIRTSSPDSINAQATGRAISRDVSLYRPENAFYQAYDKKGNYIGDIGYALEVSENRVLEQLAAGTDIAGANIPVGTKLANPIDASIGSAPYLRNVRVLLYFQGGKAQTQELDLLIIDQPPTNFTTTYSTYDMVQETDLSKDIPLLSLRLAPSVDNGVPGALGSREIINRMQLALKTLDVVCTHEVTIQLVLNPTLDNFTFVNAPTPSLSQVVYHNITDTVTGGLPIFAFKTQNGQTIVNSTSTKRQAQISEIDLAAIGELGNSILGGDGVFPDGPDVITIVARFAGDAEEVSDGGDADTGAAPFELSTRLSWAESQA